MAMTGGGDALTGGGEGARARRRRAAGAGDGPAGRRRGEAGGGHVARAGWPGGAADVSGAARRERVRVSSEISFSGCPLIYR